MRLLQQASLRVLSVGPSTSIQDGGRIGFTRFGVTRSGPMDRLSFELGNIALNKPPHSPAIEISLGGLTLQCESGHFSAALMGGSFKGKLDGFPLPPCSIFTMEAGSILSVQPGDWGSWCYLALDGDVMSETWLGSQSVHLNSGLCGMPLKSQDRIAIENTSCLFDETRHVLDANILRPTKEIRVVIGPQNHLFDEESISSLCSETFKITAEYNRMGARLSGPKLKINGKLDLPSEPIARGSLQVPGHGDPICLLADHQTTGGYPKIATVISSDQDKLAQNRIGDLITFKSVDVAQAIASAQEHARLKSKLTQVIRSNDDTLMNRLLSNNLISGVSGS